MYCTQWVMMHLVCRPNNMRLNMAVHPAVSTEKNIDNFRSQMDNIGFCFDWSREVRTSDPKYYKWTQWIFLQLFKSFYNRNTKKQNQLEYLITDI